MSKTVIKVENLSKLYRLGEVGTGTLSHDLNRWWAKVRGKEDPFAKVGQVNDRTKAAQKGEYAWALKDIDFEVKKGEVLGIIGKNGAGKSTLLKILSRITSPTTGSIKLKGRVASLLEVGTGMHPEMTGRENVYLNGTILGMSKREVSEKFEEIMDFAGCLKYADTPVKRYSSGMRVRLGFAVAAFLEPEILIVDEVLAVGDAEFQKKAIGKMQDISSGGGRTVLFVSHNMSSVESICSRGILLNNGKVQIQGKIRNVIDEYLNEETLASKWQNTIKTNREIELIQAEILDKDKVNNNNIYSNEHFFVKFLVKSKIGLENNIQFGVEVINSRNIVVFSNFNTDFDSVSYFGVKDHEFTVIIPENLLNEDTYYVNVKCSRYRRNWVFKYNHILGFNLIRSNKGNGFKILKRDGVIHPDIKWVYDQVN